MAQYAFRVKFSIFSIKHLKKLLYLLTLKLYPKVRRNNKTPICRLFSCSQLEDMQWTTLKGTEEFYTYMKVTEVRVCYVKLN